MTQGLLLDCAVYHLHGNGPIHLSRCIYMSTKVESVSPNEIQDRLYYVMTNRRCMAVIIKKTYINTCQQFSRVRMWDSSAISYRHRSWRDKTDVRHHGRKLRVSVGWLMQTTLGCDLVVQHLVSRSNSSPSLLFRDTNWQAQPRVEWTWRLKSVLRSGGAISRSGLRHVDRIAYGKLHCLQDICNLDKLRISVPYDANPASTSLK